MSALRKSSISLSKRRLNRSRSSGESRESTSPQPAASGARELEGGVAERRRAEGAGLGGVLRLEEEEARDPAVELLRHRAHLARVDDADQARPLEHFQVVADGALGHAELAGQLLRRPGAFPQ